MSENVDKSHSRVVENSETGTARNMQLLRAFYTLPNLAEAYSGQVRR